MFKVSERGLNLNSNSELKCLNFNVGNSVLEVWDLGNMDHYSGRDYDITNFKDFTVNSLRTS